MSICSSSGYLVHASHLSGAATLSPCQWIACELTLVIFTLSVIWSPISKAFLLYQLMVCLVRTATGVEKENIPSRQKHSHSVNSSWCWETEHPLTPEAFSFCQQLLVLRKRTSPHARSILILSTATGVEKENIPSCQKHSHSVNSSWCWEREHPLMPEAFSFCQQLLLLRNWTSPHARSILILSTAIGVEKLNILSCQKQSHPVFSYWCWETEHPLTPEAFSFRQQLLELRNWTSAHARSILILPADSLSSATGAEKLSIPSRQKHSHPVFSYWCWETECPLMLQALPFCKRMVGLLTAVALTKPSSPLVGSFLSLPVVKQTFSAFIGVATAKIPSCWKPFLFYHLLKKKKEKDSQCLMGGESWNPFMLQACLFCQL